jgi:hypothetical protein
MSFGDPIQNPVSFRQEARWQRVCAVCLKPTSGHFQTHHVVDVQTLRRHGVKGNALYDTRNALRLCQNLGDVDVRCHFQHENRRRVVKTGELLDHNIEYAFEVLGVFAADFLRQEYDDSERDARVELLLQRTLRKTA